MSTIDKVMLANQQAIGVFSGGSDQLLLMNIALERAISMMFLDDHNLLAEFENFRIKILNETKEEIANAVAKHNRN